MFSYFFEKDHYARRILREIWEELVEFKLCAFLIHRAIGKFDLKKPEC